MREINRFQGSQIDALPAGRWRGGMASEAQDWRRDVRVICAGVVACHLLIEPDGRGAILIDTGLWGERGQLRRALGCCGLGLRDIRAIMLTHGHLDHAGNLAWVKEQSGAPIYAHPAEQTHIDGTYRYVGLSRWCGRLEAAGRALLGAGTPARIDVPLADGDELPFWGGLRVVHLPGHTEGHCGFYSLRHDVLFSGDLFASYLAHARLPPPILNSVPALILASLEKVRRLNPRFIVPQHYAILDGALHRRRFDALVARIVQRRAERDAPAI
jgi:glyoxylase-like metal-dependent hydrolase (beta-lactamase superfamily II)